MAKAQHRKPPKRKQARPRAIDPDLSILAEVLDEHRLDNNVRGWFVVPWHDGAMATLLGRASFETGLDEYGSFREDLIHKFLVSFGDTPTREATHYYRAGELLERIDVDDVSPYLIASLRCLMVWISHSDGGGHVYNAILKKAFDVFDPSHLNEDTVLEYRCRDAIGTTSVLQGDRNDRARQAFTIAWQRGLYHAAYSIARVG